MSDNVISIEEIDLYEKKINDLSSKREKLSQTKIRLETHVDSKKTELSQLLKEIRALGYDPETIDKEIPKLKNIIEKKIEVMTEEFEATEKLFESVQKNIG